MRGMCTMRENGCAVKVSRAAFNLEQYMFGNDCRNWKRTRKKKYTIEMCKPKVGTRVTNVLEGSTYVVGDKERYFVLKGTVGETWAVDFNTIVKNYRLPNGNQELRHVLNKLINKYGVQGTFGYLRIESIPAGNFVWALHLPMTFRNVPIKTSWGDVLYANRDGVKHYGGDFLICSDMNGRPNLNDMWVVNGGVFRNTYDQRAFAAQHVSNRRIAW